MSQSETSVIDSEIHILRLILLVGATIVFSILIKAGLGHLRVPALIGYLLLGFLLRVLAARGGLLSEETWWVYEFLAHIGLIVLLFRVGLESNLPGLIRQLPRASLIWIGNVLCSAILGYVVALYLLELGVITSLILATALTATSVGVSAGVWQEANALTSSNGALLLDVAELDDLSGLICMALLFAVLPALEGKARIGVWSVFVETAGLLLFALLTFGAFCFFFSRYIEQPLTHFFLRIEPAPDPVLLVAGAGFIIAALAGLLGFSVAMGAFFAGLVFSRDPQAVIIDASFGAIYELFSPFFFIGIGLNIEPTALTVAYGPGVVLLVTAIMGKIIGTIGPALLTIGWQSALVIGISMVPRAEIAMIIMQHGLKLGDWAVPAEIFAAMVMVSAVTCMAAPLLLSPLLRQWPQTNGETA